MRTSLILLAVVAALVSACGAGEEAPPAPAPAPRTDLEADLAAFEVRTWPRPPAFGDPVPGRAWDHYREALDKLDDEEREPEVFALLAKGARTREAGSGYDLRKGIGIGVDDDSNDRLFDAANRLKVLRSRHAGLVEAGDLDAAVEGLLAFDRFGEDFGHGAPIMSHLVGITLREVAQRAAAERLGDFALAHLDPLEQWLVDSIARPPVPWDVLDGEFLAFQATLDLFARGEIPPETFGFDAEKPHEAAAARQIYARVLGLTRVRLVALRIEFPDGDPRAAGSRLRAEGRPRWTDVLARPQPERMIAGALLGMAGAVGEPLAEAWEKQLARQEALLLGIALVRHHRREGSYPESVEDFRPPAVRREPPGEPWTYRLEDGKVSIHLKEDDEEEGAEPKPFLRLE